MGFSTRPKHSLVAFGLHVGILSLHFLVIVHSAILYFTLGSAHLPDQILANGFIFKYLTYWTLIMHLVTFAVSMAADLSPDQRLVTIRDHLFNSLAFPFGGVVTITFWFFCTIDPSLVISEDAVEMYLNWKSQIVHTLPLLTCLVDSLVVNHRRRDGQHRYGMLAFLAMAVAYCSYLSFVGYVLEDWPYPILANMTALWQRLMFYAFNTSVGCVCHYMSGVLYDLYWSHNHNGNVQHLD